MDNNHHDTPEMELLAELLECLSSNIESSEAVYCDHDGEAWRFFCPLGIAGGRGPIVAWATYADSLVKGAMINPAGIERELMIADLQSHVERMWKKYAVPAPWQWKGLLTLNNLT